MENNPTPPDNTLYQYRPPKQWAFDNLQKGAVYFGAPRNFNDPHDFRTPAYQKLEDGDVHDFLGEHKIDISTQNKIPALKQAIASASASADLPNNMTDGQLRGFLNGVGMRDIPTGDTFVAIKEVLAHILDRQFTDILIVERNMSGVSCFSEHKDNALMWSRYAGNDKGFCLKFDARELEKSIGTRFFQVQYSSELPECNLFAVEPKNYSKEYAKYLAYKSPYWSYEKEWRAFKRSAGAVPYGKAALESVYLGAAADERTKALIYAIVKREYGHAKVFEAKRSDHKPAVVGFERYHPTVIAV